MSYSLKGVVPGLPRLIDSDVVPAMRLIDIDITLYNI